MLAYAVDRLTNSFYRKLCIQQSNFEVLKCQFLSLDKLDVGACNLNRFLFFPSYRAGLVQFQVDTVFLSIIPLTSPPLCPSGFSIAVICFLLVKNFGNYGKTNIASIVFGFLFSLGCTLLGNFQVTA